MSLHNTCQLPLQRPFLLDRLSRASNKTHLHSSSTQVGLPHSNHERAPPESSSLYEKVSQKFNIQPENTQNILAVPFLEHINKLHAHKFSLFQALISQTSNIQDSLESTEKIMERLRKKKRVVTNMPSLFPLTSVYQKAVLNKFFYEQTFKYQLRLIQPLQNPVFKDRNFQIKLQAVDLSGTLINIKASLQITIFTCQEDPDLIVTNLNSIYLTRKTHHQVLLRLSDGGRSKSPQKSSNQRGLLSLSAGLVDARGFVREELGFFVQNQHTVNKTLRHRKDNSKGKEKQVIVIIFSMEDSSITQRLNKLASQIIDRQHHVLNFGHSALSKLNQFSTSMCKYAGQDSQQHQNLLADLHRLALQQQGILSALKRIKSELQQEKQNSSLTNTLVESFGNLGGEQEQHMPSWRLQPKCKGEDQPLARLSFEKTVRPPNSNKQRLQDLERKIDKIRDKIKIMQFQQNFKKKKPNRKSAAKPAKIRSVSMVNKKCCRA